MKPFLPLPISMIICLILGIASASADNNEHTDSIPTVTNLEEFIVEAERSWIENGRIVYIPSKKEKQLANSPETLIESMNIPALNVSEGQIRTYSGKEVAIFINGRLADKVDLATFWPRKAMRVEYVENPREDEFAGYRNVVNFVMTEYQSGGITKFNVSQQYPWIGNYDVASKFIHKNRFSLGLVVSGNVADIKEWQTSKGKETFSRLYYDGQFYENIQNSEQIESAMKQYGLNTAIVQKYISTRFAATHQISLKWTRDPGTMTSGQKLWSPDIFGSDDYGAYSSNSALTPSVSGQYNWAISQKWSVGGRWGFTHSHNKYSSWDKTGETPAIDNNTVENVNALYFKITPQFWASKRFIFNYNLEVNFDFYNTRYSGYSNNQCIQHRQDIDNQLGIWWTLSNTLYLFMSPRLSMTLWQIDNGADRQINPSVTLGAQWEGTRKFNLSGEIAFNRYSASADKLNPVLVRNSELLWTKGNPMLRNSTLWTMVTTINYIPCRQVSFSMFANYSRMDNSTVFEYIPMDKDSEGLLRTPYNGAPEDHISLTLSIPTSWFDRKLSLNFQGSYSYIDIHDLDKRFSTFQGKISASYILGNVRFSCNYNPPSMMIRQNGREKVKFDDELDFSLTYGWKSIYLQFAARNILHNHTHKNIQYLSPYYSYEKDMFTPGRRFSVDLTYTFGYGKEITPDIPVSTPQLKSNVLR